MLASLMVAVEERYHLESLANHECGKVNDSACASSRCDYNVIREGILMGAVEEVGEFGNNPVVMRPFNNQIALSNEVVLVDAHAQCSLQSKPFVVTGRVQMWCNDGTTIMLRNNLWTKPLRGI